MNANCCSLIHILSLLKTVKSAQALQTTQNSMNVLLKSTRGKIHYLKKKKKRFLEMLWYSCHDSIMRLTNTEATCTFKLSARSKKMKRGAVVTFALRVEQFSGTILVQSATTYACNHYCYSPRGYKTYAYILYKTICKKQCLKHHFRSYSTCNFLFFFKCIAQQQESF